MNISNESLSRLVRDKLKTKGLTLEECCKAFNNKYEKQIRDKKIKPLNKDFVSRVVRNDFKVISGRISNLCEFLEIHDRSDLHEHLKQLAVQIQAFEDQVNSDAFFKTKYSAIFSFLKGLSISQIEQGGSK